MNSLPLLERANICLSGPMDVFSSLIGSPDILFDEHAYSPIICLSSFVHVDPRLVLIIKSYGPNLEFWCLSQMLSNTKTQVSEQWTAGISIYEQ